MSASRGLVGPTINPASTGPNKHLLRNWQTRLTANRFLTIPALPKAIMSITHIVLFQFKSGIDAKVVQDVRY